MERGKVDAHGYFLFFTIAFGCFLTALAGGLGIYYNIKNREAHDNLHQSVMNRSVQTIATKPEIKKEKKPVWKLLGTFNVSAYCPKNCCCGRFADYRTATMTNALTKGIAVDPSKIKLGSTLFIRGYGIAIADDVGGKIKGNKIDLRFRTHKEALNFGRKYLKVYIKIK